MWDAFWNSWIAPLPDVLSADWFGAVRDVISLVVGGVGTYLAWLAIKMGREQDAAAAKQMAIMEGQQVLLQELKALEAKQAETADAHHRMVLDERNRRASLELKPMRRSSGLADGGRRYRSYEVWAVNSGTRDAQGLDWHVCLPHTHLDFEIRKAADSRVVREEVLHDDDGNPFDVVSGRFDGSVYAGRSVPLFSVYLEHAPGCELPEPLKCYEYYIECADGRFPASGWAKVSTAIRISFAEEDLEEPEPVVDNSGPTP